MDGYHYQLCECCGTNGLLKRSSAAGQVSSHISTQDNWICTNCINTTSQPGSHVLQDDAWPQDLLQIPSSSSSPSHSLPSNTCATEVPESEHVSFLKSCKGPIFCHLNANSIRPRFEEINHLLSSVTIALFAVTESKLDSARDSVTQFQINGYNSIRSDRLCKTKKSGGGIIVYVHDSFSFQQLDFN
jgi:hypothetical protein